jgi:predicted porin
MYGVMDVNTYSTSVTTAAGVDAASVTEYAATAATSAASGMGSGGLSGSRWGIKGSEDIGGGLTASFQLESSITASTGASTGFTRTSAVGVAGGFGSVSAGVLYTPSYSVIGGSDIDGTSGYTTSNLYPSGVRGSGGFLYTSPKMGDLTAKIMYSNNASGLNDTTKASLQDISLSYAAGPLSVAVGMSTLKGVSAAVAGVTLSGTTTAQVLAVAATDTTTKGNVLGVSYDLGVAKVMLNTATSKRTNNLTATTTFKMTESNFGVSVPMGAISLVAGYGKNKVTLGTAAGVSTNDNMIGANYRLSKRTDMYVRMSKTGTINASGVDAGKVNTTAVGLRHTF